mgnify:CR=1 FL=1
MVRRVCTCGQSRTQTHGVSLLGAVAGLLCVLLILLHLVHLLLVLRGELGLVGLHLSHDLCLSRLGSLSLPLPGRKVIKLLCFLNYLI